MAFRYITVQPVQYSTAMARPSWRRCHRCTFPEGLILLTVSALVLRSFRCVSIYWLVTVPLRSQSIVDISLYQVPTHSLVFLSLDLSMSLNL